MYFRSNPDEAFWVSAIYTVQMLLLTLVFFWQLVMLYTNPKAWKARDKMLVRLRHGIDGDVDSEAAKRLQRTNVWKSKHRIRQKLA
jgi:hypothetical protein